MEVESSCITLTLFDEEFLHDQPPLPGLEDMLIDDSAGQKAIGAAALKSVTK